MSQKIRRLPEDVINKIAAGEVVENPASIVKELIENSLDAGSTQIDIQIEGGGAKAICIEDNGFGMSPEDAPFALERHATSKIFTEHDLFSLTTMGFRGEALAAIAAVSKLELKTSDGLIGSHIESLGGSISFQIPCARNRGTTLVVRDLFFNVPARKNFLKSPRTHTSQVARLLEALSLAHPPVGFSLMSENKEIFRVFPEGRKERIFTVLGSLPYEIEGEGLWGLMSAPDASKKDRTGQYVFVNERFVVSPLLSKAVKEGYGTCIAESDHPSFVLYLSVPPDTVDVNVHPQKKEIRFSESHQIFRSVRAASSAVMSPGFISFPQEISFPAPDFSFETFEPMPLEREASAESLSFSFAPMPRPLAIVAGFLILQTDKVLIVDLKAAHARVLYESLQNKTFALQTLLLPIEVPMEDFLVEQELADLGLECRRLSEKIVAIDAIPSGMEREDFIHFFDAWKLRRKLDQASSACALHTKKKYSLEEGVLLWQQLEKCSNSLFCPKGQKIWGEMNSEKIKKVLEIV